MKDCKNGGKAIIDVKNGLGSDPYMCKCAHGYRGNFCEFGRYSATFVQLKIDGKAWKKSSPNNVKDILNTRVSLTKFLIQGLSSIRVVKGFIKSLCLS